MDKTMQSLIGITASVMQKWEVVFPTDTRRGIGGTGWSMGKLQPGVTFFGNWIVTGWVKDNDASRWIKVSDCIKIVSEEPLEPPPSDSTLCWLKSDWELRNTKFSRDRVKGTSGWPQTMKFAHPPNTGGVAKGTDDYIALTLALNPGMTYEGFKGMMDAFVPLGCKWRTGDNKVAFEIQFASNTISVLRRFRNGGGMSGIPTGAWLYEADVLDYDNLPTNVFDVQEKHIIHFTISRKDSPNVNPPPFMGGRSEYPYQPTKLLFTSPIPLYFRVELGQIVSNFKNQYVPEWIP